MPRSGFFIHDSSVFVFLCTPRCARCYQITSWALSPPTDQPNVHHRAIYSPFPSYRVVMNGVEPEQFPLHRLRSPVTPTVISVLVSTPLCPQAQLCIYCSLLHVCGRTFRHKLCQPRYRPHTAYLCSRSVSASRTSFFLERWLPAPMSATLSPPG